LHELLLRSAERTPQAVALVCAQERLDYATLQTQVQQCTNALLGLGLKRGERVGIYLEKSVQAVVASFAAAAAGAVMVPINPVLKAEQVGYILQDCQVRVLVTSPQRQVLLAPLLGPGKPGQSVAHVLLGWSSLADSPARAGHRVIDTDIAAILYTSGSTGGPKGVVLSHRNLVLGARSVAAYQRWRLPRLSAYALVGFALAPTQAGLLPQEPPASMMLLANMAFCLILFECGYRINLRWLQRNPWIAATSLLEAGLSFAAVYCLLLWWGLPMASALPLAALGMASSPATVVRVVSECRSSG
jgi:acyl-CoA synthetase (AMP-forming)/AMP-acid ligase II